MAVIRRASWTLTGRAPTRGGEAAVRAQQGGAATKAAAPSLQRARVASFASGRAPTVAVRIHLWRGFVEADAADVASAVEVECHPHTDIAEVRAALAADGLEQR